MLARTVSVISAKQILKDIGPDGLRKKRWSASMSMGWFEFLENPPNLSAKDCE